MITIRLFRLWLLGAIKFDTLRYLLTSLVRAKFTHHNHRAYRDDSGILRLSKNG